MPNYAGVDLVNMGREAEKMVGTLLRSRGYHIEPADNYRYDLLCDHKVRIEVKTAYPSGTDIVWAFNSRKRLEDHCDVVVLIANIDGHARHYVLPADHQVFYNSNGEPKAGIGITRNPSTLKPTGRTLERHYERWDLIRQIRDGEYLKVEQPTLF
jgi:hypothetical protein